MDLKNLPLASDPGAQSIEQKLPGSCLLRSVADLKSQFLAVAKDPRSLLVDASAVEQIDCAALQVLVAVALERARAGRHFAIRAPSEAFRSAVSTLGLGPVLPVMNGALP